MIIHIDNNGIILRDRIPADVDDYVRWFTGNPEWKLWDAPWEKIVSPEEIKVKISASFEKPLLRPRKRFEICQGADIHIGWVSSYRMKENKENICVGLAIAESQCWGKGAGTAALKAWLAYLFSTMSADDIYCETWSGNSRVIHVAEKCGFIESGRLRDTREVSGKKYDGLSFHLERAKFNELNDVIIHIEE